MLMVRFQERHARTPTPQATLRWQSNRRGAVTKTPPDGNLRAAATTPPPAFGEFCWCWGSWVTNLRPARTPDQTAARNGKIDAQRYTSVIASLHDKVCLKLLHHLQPD